MTVISEKELEKARKKAARRERIEQIKRDAEYFYQNHKELVIPVATGAVVQGGRIVLQVLRSSTANREIDFKNKHIYDPRSGLYVETKHKLNQREAVRLDELRTQGYSVTEALRQMKILK